MSNEIEQLELSIENAKKLVAKRDALVALHNNKHFQLVVSEGYFKEEACRLVMAKSHPNFEDPSQQASVIRSIDSIGEFDQYLRSIMHFGNEAEKSLVDDAETHAELLMED